MARNQSKFFSKPPLIFVSSHYSEEDTFHKNYQNFFSGATPKPGNKSVDHLLNNNQFNLNKRNSIGKNLNQFQANKPIDPVEYTRNMDKFFGTENPTSNQQQYPTIETQGLPQYSSPQYQNFKSPSNKAYLEHNSFGAEENKVHHNLAQQLHSQKLSHSLSMNNAPQVMKPRDQLDILEQNLLLQKQQLAQLQSPSQKQNYIPKTVTFPSSHEKLKLL